MGLFKNKFRDWPIVKAIGGGAVDAAKQIPGVGRFVTILFDRGEKGKLSLKDFQWRDLIAFGVGGLILFGIVKGWFTMEELIKIVEQLSGLI